MGGGAARVQALIMAKRKKAAAGTILWHDLTVKDADAVSQFYASVVGWKRTPVDMGGYEDYGMVIEGKKGAAGGICHRKGANAKLPAQWLVYIAVEDLAASLKQVRKLGGKVRSEIMEVGEGTACVIQDPAGAVCALFQAP